MLLQLVHELQQHQHYVQCGCSIYLNVTMVRLMFLKHSRGCILLASNRVCTHVCLGPPLVVVTGSCTTMHLWCCQVLDVVVFLFADG